MKIKGVGGLTPEQVTDEVLAGAKFVVFQWVFSIVVKTFKKGTDVYYIRPRENAALKGIPWTLLSFVAGWWGFWGIVHTPTAVVNNLSGGKDVTYSVMNLLMAQPSTVPLPADYPLEAPLKNPWGEEKLKLRAAPPVAPLDTAPPSPKRKAKKK